MGKFRCAAPFASTVMKMKRKLMNCLQELKMKYNNSSVIICEEENVQNLRKELECDGFVAVLDEAENVLNVIYQVGRKRMNFTKAERRQIGNLVFDVIIPIRLYIRHAMFHGLTSMLMKRCALQFLVEHYGKFPARNSTLLEELKIVNIKESIDVLDGIDALWDTYSEEKDDLWVNLYREIHNLDKYFK